MQRSELVASRATLAWLCCAAVVLISGCATSLGKSGREFELPPPQSSAMTSANAQQRAAISSRLAGLHLPFTPNIGQDDAHIKYSARTFGGTVAVTDAGQLRYTLPKIAQDLSRAEATANGPQGVVLYEEFVGGTVEHIVGEGPATPVVNSFHGNDPAKWHAAIPTYGSINLGEVYPGIAVNLQAHGSSVEKLFHVEPGADPATLRLRFNGSDRLAVTHDGQLDVATGLGSVRFSRPVAYQLIDGGRRDVDVAYALDTNTYGFKLGEYDRTREVVIDPVLAATFLGGQGKDSVTALAVNAAGEVFVVGGTLLYSSPPAQPVGFPGVDATSLDSTFAGTPPSHDGWRTEGFVVKLNAQLTDVLAATFLGGTRNESVRALALDTAGNLFVGGMTESTDFPGVNAASADSTVEGYIEAFVIKLSPGLDAILGATLLGGDDYEYVLGIATDTSGHVYAAGGTNSSDFPGVMATSADSTAVSGDGAAGPMEGFIARLDTGLHSITHATFLGGSNGASISAIATAGATDVYVVGATNSTDLPGINASSADSVAVANEGFVARLNSTLTQIVAATYMGGSDYDYASAIALDSGGNVFVAGSTYSADFPGISGTAADSILVNEDAFVARLNGGLGTIQAATFLGGEGTDRLTALALDGVGGVYVGGRTNSQVFPGISEKSYDADPSGEVDGYIARLSDGLTSITSATFMGEGGSAVEALGLDSTGKVFAGGHTYSSDLPKIGPASADSIFEEEGEAEGFNGSEGFVVNLGKCNSDIVRIAGGPLDACKRTDEFGPLFNPARVDCSIVDCCPHCPGMYAVDWEIYATGAPVIRLVLRFEGLEPVEIERIGIEGPAHWSTAGHLVMTAGAKVTLRGLPQPTRAADAFRMNVETIYFDGVLNDRVSVTVKEMVDRRVVTRKVLALVGY